MQVTLHSKQQEVIDALHRFIVFAAGRRSGKTFLLALWLLIKAMEPEREGVNYTATSRVLYVAPTLGMADDLMRDLFADIAKDYIKSFNVKKLEFTMVNGRKVKLAGCDKPRSLRGGSIIALGMDEVQDININEVWNRILRPACGDLKAPAVFIGTPLPGSSEEWHSLYKMGLDEKSENWTSIHCNSTDNPFIDMQAEIDQARLDGVSEAIIQAEFFANFELAGASHFELENLQFFDEVPKGCTTFVAVDLAGFGSLEGLTLGQVKRLDETAIATVSVDPTNNFWYVREIKHGRWSVDETARKIAEVVATYSPQKLGLEKGTSFNAIMPYLEIELNKVNAYPMVVPLSHENKGKTDRIFWALQGRLERGMIIFPQNTPKWLTVLKQQLIAMPAKHVHDDLADGLAYINQLAQTMLPQETYDGWEDDDEDRFEPLDDVTGF